MKVQLLAITPDAEKLIEEAGRTCYLSFARKKKGSEKKFIQMLIKHGHTSVLEHAYVTFRIMGASRAFTHQLVRHRLCSFSQQSQRYVDEKRFKVVVPPRIEKNPEAKEMFNDTLDRIKKAYQGLQKMGIPNEDARFLLPNATVSEIVFSCNFRELRHIFLMRGSRRVQWEIREICIEMLRIMKKKAPTVFGDLVIDKTKKTIEKRKESAK